MKALGTQTIETERLILRRFVKLMLEPCLIIGLHAQKI